MSKSLIRVGDLDATENRNEEAKESYEHAFTIMSAIIRQGTQAPSDEILRELTWTYSKLGDVNVRLLNFPDALVAYEKALCIRQTMSARQPQQTLLRSDVSFTLEKIGNARLRSGDLDAAATAFMDAIIIRRGLYVSDKAQLRWLRDLASALQLYAAAKRRSGDLKTARAFFLAAAMKRRELMLRQPQDEWSAQAFNESMAAAREALAAFAPGASERAEEIWTAVVGNAIEQATAKNVRTASDQKVCLNDIITEFRTEG
jgi:tetratricopeptide (TPR) repeat protein